MQLVNVLLAFVATFYLAEATSPLPSDYVIALLWPNNKCQGPAAVSIPIEIPAGTTDVCDQGPIEIDGTPTPLLLWRNGVLLANSTEFIGMTCNGAHNRSYSYGNASCSNIAATKSNFEEYCLTTTADFGYPFPISARLLCKSNENLGSCGPRRKENKNKCTSKANRCASTGQLLKWTPKACKKNGKATGTSGCQCVGYCGYSCKGACNKDPECHWNGTDRACWSKATPLYKATRGGPIPNCPVGGLAGLDLESNEQPKALKDEAFLFVQALASIFNQ